MIGKQRPQTVTQCGEHVPLVRGQGSNMGVDPYRRRVTTHSAAFISKPSSILSDGATG